MTATHLSDRAILRLHAVDGQEDVRTFLQGLVTNDTRLVAPGHPIWAALLSAQGKALFDFIIWDDGKDVLIDCEAEQADALAKRLSLYRLRRKINIARDEAVFVHWSPDATDHGKDPRLESLGCRWLGDEAAEDVAPAWRAHRLSLGVTEGAAELGQDQTLWLECNAVELRGVTFDKGCYVGQENTARMNWRQKINRRLVVVPQDQAEEKRQRVAYPALGLSVEHRRVEDLATVKLPSWLAASLNKAEQ